MVGDAEGGGQEEEEVNVQENEFWNQQTLHRILALLRFDSDLRSWNPSFLICKMEMMVLT